MLFQPLSLTPQHSRHWWFRVTAMLGSCPSAGISSRESGAETCASSHSNTHPQGPALPKGEGAPLPVYTSVQAVWGPWGAGEGLWDAVLWLWGAVNASLGQRSRGVLSVASPRDQGRTDTHETPCANRLPPRAGEGGGAGGRESTPGGWRGSREGTAGAGCAGAVGSCCRRLMSTMM